METKSVTKEVLEGRLMAPAADSAESVAVVSSPASLRSPSATEGALQPLVILRTGVARIGRGSKLHPAREYQDGNRIWTRLVCHCPGTQSGRAHNKASFLWGEQHKPTCGAA